MTQSTSQKPAYLNLLNLICLQEGRAGVFLRAWADKTPDPQLKECLNFVAARETSHHDIFERRIRELGFAKEEKEDPSFAERLEVLGSDRTDADKIRWNKEVAAKQAKPTVRDRFEDHVRGSHHYLREPSRASLVVVPVHGHRTLPLATLRSILRQAGITPQDLVELLRA